MYSGQFFKTILDSVSESISVIDVNDFSIIGANRAFLKQYGLTDTQVSGRKCYELTHRRNTPCTAPADICPIDNMMASGEHSVEEHIHYNEKGDMIFVEVYAYPILDDKGKIIQAVHLCRDITERKNMEGQLHGKILELQGLNNIFRKHLAVRSETELAYVSLTTSISQLSGEINNLLKKAQSQDMANQATLVMGLIGLADEIGKLVGQAEAMVSKINLPPAERL